MRRWIAAAASALLMLPGATTANAQSMGFKVGPTWSKLDLDPNQGTAAETLTSIGGGGFLRFALGLPMQLEFLVVTRGAAFPDPVVDAESKIKINYLEVPLTFMVPLGNGPYAFFGPNFAFEIGCDAQLVEVSQDTGTGEVDVDEIDVKCKDEPDLFERRKFDVGVTGGLGLALPLGAGAFLIEGRYTHGLTDINEQPGSADQKMRHRSFGAMIGYALPIGN